MPNAQFIVHSEQLKNEMISSHKIKSEKIHVFPFIIDNKFSEITPQKIDKIKKDIDILPNQKVILIAGGGEGLSGVVKIVRSFVQLKDEKTNDVVLIVVCGRNFTSFKIIDKIRKKHKNKQIKLYGFVNNMDSLINIADCVITKGGASMLMQVSACCKPVIFSTYIHGQEKGNVDFAIQNKTGWFIRKAEKVIDKALQVCFDEKLKSEIKSKLKSII